MHCLVFKFQILMVVSKLALPRLFPLVVIAIAFAHAEWPVGVWDQVTVFKEDVRLREGKLEFCYLGII